MTSRRRFLLQSGALGIGLLTGCGTSAAPTTTPVRVAAARPTKVAFVYLGPISDTGWTWSHEQGRRALEQALPNRVATVYKENVPEDPILAEAAIREFAKQGHDVIVATSFGYLQPTLAVAKDYPQTTFVHVSGDTTAPNVSTAFGKIEEPRYVSGLVVGRLTKTNTVGYIAAFPIPEVVRGINAFTLGLRKTNPAATVKVTWTNTWYDPAKERAAAEALLDAGADIMAQHQDTTAAMEAAKERGKLSIGYHSDIALRAPATVITSVAWNWGKFYTGMVEQYRAGTWKNTQYWGGWREGVVDLGVWGSMITDELRLFAAGEITKFQTGQQSIYTIFGGPLKDQSGAVRVPAGVTLTDAELLSMNWLVEGVVGVLPPKQG